MNLAGFDRPKVCKKKILCLYSPSLKVHSTKTSSPLRFSELRKQRASKKFCIRGFQHSKLVEILKGIVFVFNLFCFDP